VTSTRSEPRFSRYATNGVTLHVAEAGPPDGPLVLLLHGFPEFWYGWRHQIAVLADAGFRVAVPDQRGYNLSDRPKGVAAYDIDLLALDIVGLADTLGRQKFYLVGHDWGAGVGWWIASHHADRVERFAALSAPHPAVWIDAIRTIPEQRKKSWYVKAFGIPWLPEFLLRQRKFKGLTDALRDCKRPADCTDADLDRYREAWSQPGALTAMLNWYRAIAPKQKTMDPARRVTVPTLIIWGDGDRYGVPALAERSAHLCDNARIVHLDATHWVQHDEPDRVNAMLIEFLKMK
jgi:epoxide hydrolase 4